MDSRRSFQLWSSVSVGAVSLGLVSCGNVDSKVGMMVSETGGASARGGTQGDGGRQPSGGAGTGGATAAKGGSMSMAGSSTGGEDATGGADATGGVPPTGSETTGMDLSGSPLYSRVQRLTKQQWQNAVRDILRLTATPEPGEALEAAAPYDADFSNNERLLVVRSPVAEALEVATEAAAAAATGSADTLSAMYSGDDRAGFVQTLGRRAFRRPLTTEEQARYEAVFVKGEALYGSGFANGAGLVIRAMLQSPSFLYRSELGPAGEALSSYEIASKLSFWLLGTTPSDELLDAAARGELDTESGVELTASKMLEAPAAFAMVRDFHGQLYRVTALDLLSNPEVVDPTGKLNSELREASYRFFERVFEQDQGLGAILTSTRGFVGPALAPLYAAAETPKAIVEQELGPSRTGYFLQLPFLMRRGPGLDPDTVRRGYAIANQVLCEKLVPPAASSPVPALDPDQTNRERMENLTSSCGSNCHANNIDALGFAFEAFDGIGRERELDNGKPIDSSASYPFTDGVVTFNGAQELMKILVERSQAHVCYAKKVASYALARDIVAQDVPLLEELAPSSDSLKQLIVALALNPSFRLRAEDRP